MTTALASVDAFVLERPLCARALPWLLPMPFTLKQPSMLLSSEELDLMQPPMLLSLEEVLALSQPLMLLSLEESLGLGNLLLR